MQQQKKDSSSNFTTVFLIRAIQAVLVSITHIGVKNTTVVRAQEVGRRARCDGRICQSQIQYKHMRLVEYFMELNHKLLILKLSDGPCTLTAVVFIRAVTAVVVAVTQPIFRDASFVITCEVPSSAGGGETSGAVNLVRSITTVVSAITAPTGQDAMLVVAGEGLGRAGRSWKLIYI